MDKQLHAETPAFIDKGKLVKSNASAKSFSTFLFEPTGLVPFQVAWDWQRNWQAQLLKEPSSQQAVWLLQHYSCYTLGRGGNEKNLLFNRNKPPAALFQIDRGGEVTHHLPGQLVVYPVLDLHNYKTDLNWYLRELEQVTIEVLKSLGLSGSRIPGLTGLWLDGRKVASIGIGCRRWITQHGLALNVNCQLDGFQQVIPCGLKGTSVDRLSNWIPGLEVADVQPLIRESLSKQFGLTWQAN